MPVSTRHPEFEEAYPKIEITEAAVEGDVQEYVPRLTGQTQKAWQAYVGRAAYFNVTERALIALVGALLRKPYVLSSATEPISDETCFNEFLQRCYRSVLTQARVGLHVDFDEALQSPKLIAYESENIINWCERFVVIQECVHERDPDDEFVLKSIQQWRELRLNEDGVYEVRLWRLQDKKYVVHDTQIPLIRGKALQYIPFWISTPYDNSNELYSPPLFGLAELNIQHFKLSVDHGHGLHFTALPTPYITGDLQNSDPNAPSTKLVVGSDTVWHLTQGSSVGYLEFSGAGLAAIKAQIEHVEEQMYSAGSRLLTTKRGVESVEALQLRSGSESAMLITVAQALEQALNRALATYSAWTGSTTADTVILNKDFTASVIDPAQIKILLDAYAAKAISLETLLKRLYDGEIIDDVQAEQTALSGANISNSV